MRIAPAALLVMLTASVEAGPQPAPIAVHLVPVEDGVIQGLDPAKAERVLRERLARKKSITLVPDEEGAAIVLRVTQLAGWGEKKHTGEASDRVFFKPGGETSYGARTERTRYVSIVVRATWGERFRDLVSHESDKTIKAAADSVADELDRFARKR